MSREGTKPIQSRGIQSVGLFTQNKDPDVQSIILYLVNNNCSSLKAMMEGPRLEQRVNLSIPVIVVPIQGGMPDPTNKLTTVTRDFSTSGVSIAVDHPHVPKEAVMIFKSLDKPVFIRAESKHLDPMGGGFFQCGYQLTKVFDASLYPSMENLGETL